MNHSNRDSTVPRTIGTTPSTIGTMPGTMPSAPRHIQHIYAHRHVDQMYYDVSHASHLSRDSSTREWIGETDTRFANMIIATRDYWYTVGTSDASTQQVTMSTQQVTMSTQQVTMSTQQVTMPTQQVTMSTQQVTMPTQQATTPTRIQSTPYQMECDEIQPSDVIGSATPPSVAPMDDTDTTGDTTGDNGDTNGDTIGEVENILDTRMQDGTREYLVKWVGSKKPTWIGWDDFIEHDLVDEYHAYTRARDTVTEQPRAYIYCRTSKRNAEREVSLHDQERQCLEYARNNGIVVIGVYKDNGVSAKNFDNQFALNHIITNLLKPRDMLLFYDVSRFSRSSFQAIERLEHMRVAIGAVAHAVRDSVSWNDVAMNRHNFRQNLSASQMHSEVIAEKVRSAIQYKRDRGDWIGYVPYGYTTQMVDGVKKLVRLESEVQVIRQMFDQLVGILADKLAGVRITDEGTGGKGCNKGNKSNSRKLTKRPRKHDTSLLVTDDYRRITETINQTHANRNGKPFLWIFVKRTMERWKDKM